MKTKQATQNRRKGSESNSKSEIDPVLSSRLDDSAKRLNSALDLGYRGIDSTSTTQYSNLEWKCTDVYLHQTFTRTFSSYVEILTSNFDLFHKSSTLQSKINRLMNKSIPALDVTLQSTDKTVRSKSLSACALLACKGTRVWVQLSPTCLIHRFLSLLDDKDSFIIENACKCVVVTFVKCKIKQSSQTFHSMLSSSLSPSSSASSASSASSSFWKSISNSNILPLILNQIKTFRSNLKNQVKSINVEKKISENSSNAYESSPSLIAYSGLLHVLRVLVEKWYEARSVISGDDSWHVLIIDNCHLSMDDHVFFATYCVLNSITKHVKDVDGRMFKYFTRYFHEFMECFSMSSSLLIEELMLFLSYFSKTKHFWRKITERCLEKIINASVNTLTNTQKHDKQSFLSSSSSFFPSPSSISSLNLTSINNVKVITNVPFHWAQIMHKRSGGTLCTSVFLAVKNILSLPGFHHSRFVQSGLVKILVNFFVSEKGFGLIQKSRLLLWKILQLLGNFWEVDVNANGKNKKWSKGNGKGGSGRNYDDLFQMLPLFMSGAILRTQRIHSSLTNQSDPFKVNNEVKVKANGKNSDAFDATFCLPVNFSPNPFEIIQILKTTLSFIQSPSQTLSDAFRTAMSRHLCMVSPNWLSSMSSKLLPPVNAWSNECNSVNTDENLKLVSDIYLTAVAFLTLDSEIVTNMSTLIVRLFTLIHGRMRVMSLQGKGSEECQMEKCVNEEMHDLKKQVLDQVDMVEEEEEEEGYGDEDYEDDNDNELRGSGLGRLDDVYQLSEKGRKKKTDSEEEVIRGERKERNDYHIILQKEFDPCELIQKNVLRHYSKSKKCENEWNEEEKMEDDVFSLWEGKEVILLAAVHVLSILLNQSSDWKDAFKSFHHDQLNHDIDYFIHHQHTINENFLDENYALSIEKHLLTKNGEKLKPSFQSPSSKCQSQSQSQNPDSNLVRTDAEKGSETFNGWMYDCTMLIFKCLMSLTGVAFSEGVRSHASNALRSFGIYGFVSEVGEDMKHAFNTQSFHSDTSDTTGMSDLSFVFSDGRILTCHRVIVAARCPFLLSSFSKHSNSNPSTTDVANPESFICSDSRRTVTVNASTRADVAESTIQNIKKTVIKLSKKVDFDSFLKLMQFVYRGLISVFNEQEKDKICQLARACKFDCLSFLIYNDRIIIGLPPSDCNFTSALHYSCMKYSDVILQTGGESEGKDDNDKLKNENECQFRTNDHELHPNLNSIHCHRFILSCRSHYFFALFNANMRDSESGIISLPITNPYTISAFLRYLYSGKLCFKLLPEIIASISQITRMHHSSQITNLSSQFSVLQNLDQILVPKNRMRNLEILCAAIQLIHLSDVYLMESLSILSEKYVLKRMSEHGSAILIAVCAIAYDFGLWKIVNHGVNILSFDFLSLRDHGMLDCLNEQIREAIRIQHVKLWTMV